jgi:hypothetical protein
MISAFASVHGDSVWYVFVYIKEDVMQSMRLWGYTARLSITIRGGIYQLYRTWHIMGSKSMAHYGEQFNRHIMGSNLK